jgi:hypothetical protein
MVYIKILIRRNIYSLTKKILYWRIPIEIKMVGVPKEPLSIAY